MKTSQNLSKIINKLPKTDLKQVEVRLSVMDDIEELINNAFGLEDFVEDFISEAKNAAMKASDIVRFDMNDSIIQAEDMINETDKKLKDLGAESSELEGFKSQIGKLEAMQSDLERKIDQIGQ